MYSAQTTEFAEFFRELVKDAKQPLDPAELRRLMAIGLISKPPNDIAIEAAGREIVIRGLHKYLAGCIFLRSVYLHYNGDSEKANDFSLNAIGNIEKWKYWPFELDLTNMERSISAFHALAHFIPGSNPREIGGMLAAFYAVEGQQTEIQSDVNINPAVLDALAIYIRQRKKDDLLWSIFPYAFDNSYAVLGNTLSDSHIGTCDIETKFTSDHIAVLLQHPCEADHLEKAKLMLDRGVRVERPLGRLLIDEMQFSLFQWVPGQKLDHMYGAADVWEAYGRFVRSCHNNGIALDDAAGRNAIWNGREITGIDFEHTWFSEEAKPLEWADRRKGIERIRTELGYDFKPVYAAFRKGYDASEHL